MVVGTPGIYYGGVPMHNGVARRFVSNAEWPNGEVTTDRHGTREQAQAVCDGLERMGYGGDGLVFPVRTWVEEV